MKIFRPGRNLLVLPAVAVIAVLLFFLPIEVPYSVSAPGKIMPAKEWILTKGSDGTLISYTTDHLSGVAAGYTVSQFERGDAVSFQMRPGFTCGNDVSIHDTIAYINSNELEKSFYELKGDLETANASLEYDISGEKETIISQESGNLSLMKKQAEEQLKIFKRVEALFQRNLASQEEYDIAKGTAELNEINIRIAEARLKTVQTGAKPQQLEIVRSQITSLKRQLDIIQKKMGSYTITSPIDGVINRASSGDTLLMVSGTADFIVLVPVRWDYHSYIKTGQVITVEIPGTTHYPEAEIINMDKKVSFLNGSQVFMVTAIVRKNSNELIGGVLTHCNVDCGKVTLIEYVKRLLKSVI